MRYALALPAAIIASLFCATTLYGQDCASAPLLERRAALGVEMSHSLGETGTSAWLGAHLVGPLEIGSAYRATRLADVDRLQHEGSLELSAPVGFAGIDFCPIAGFGYAHLTTDKAEMHGHVGTTESRIGGSVSHSFELSHAVRVTPFVQPMFVRQNVSWESVDGDWRVSDQSSSRAVQYWFGISLATSRSAVVARLRPARGQERREFSIGVVTAFGRRE